MTLILMAINDRGVWQCSDRRVTRLGPAGKVELVEDESIKHVSLRFPDGSALVAYTGLAYIGDLHVSEWIGKCLLGQRLTIMETLRRIQDRATEDIRDRVHHDFLWGGFQNGRPWAARITNRALRGDSNSVPPGRKFVMGCAGINTPKVFRAGASRAVSPNDWTLLHRVAKVRSKAADLRRLLATVNRRAAQARHPDSRFISPECVSVSLDPSGNTESQIFHWKKQRVPAPAIPAVWCGIDATTLETLIPALVRESIQFEVSTPAAREELDRILDDAGREILRQVGKGQPRLHRPPKG